MCETLPVVGGLFTGGRREAQAVLSLVVQAVLWTLSGAVAGFVWQRSGRGETAAA